MPITREELAPKASITRRVGYLLIGVAIGFVMLGLVQKSRRAEWERKRAAEQKLIDEYRPGMPIPPQTPVDGAPAVPATTP